LLAQSHVQDLKYHVKLEVISSLKLRAYTQALDLELPSDKSALREPTWKMLEETRRGLLQGEETLPFAHREASARKKRVAEICKIKREYEEKLRSEIKAASTQDDSNSDVRRISY
jgi:hypothetical protein